MIDANARGTAAVPSSIDDDSRHRERSAEAARAALSIPRATYRLQLNHTFTFAHATRLVPYLCRLGVSHVYCSPYLRARPGSLHGYDVVDHNTLNPEIGSSADLDALSAALKAHGMGQILDIVPNHMGLGSDNHWWRDVLEYGAASPYARYFDIDWNAQRPALAGKVLLPILGGRYGDVLDRGEIRLGFDAEAGEFKVHYSHHHVPIRATSYSALLEHRLSELEACLGIGDERARELATLAAAFAHLPGATSDPKSPARGIRRSHALLKHRLGRLARSEPAIAAHIERVLAEWNGRPGEPSSFDHLHALLEGQAYRLADWQVAADEINYRRFFDVNDLGALAMEEPGVFEATHALTLRLIAEGKVHGLRIDHPDGLHDPEAYFRRLQESAAVALGLPGPPADGRSLYLVIEKILASHETLPVTWPVHGTTGYDFLNLVNGIFVDPRGARRIERFYRRITGEHASFEHILHDAKRQVIDEMLVAEMTVLANSLASIAEADRHTRDFTLNRLRHALAEVIAWLPVYRTYIRAGEVSKRDRRIIDWAIGLAGKRARPEDTSLYAFLAHTLLTDSSGGPDTAASERRKRSLRFAMRVQQFSSPVMAKGAEDTAFYRYVPLASLNEVGGDPQQAGISIARFHSANTMRARRWPQAMLASSTHDSKRSEDVRARLDVLSELDAEWRAHLRRFGRMARRRKRQIDGVPAPSTHDEYLFYQTVLGVWPLGSMAADPALIERIEAYSRKAAREAKRLTAWTRPNDDYEAALAEFIRSMLTPGAHDIFIGDISRFADRIAYFGWFNALAQCALKLTAPGVPDLYQGSELTDLSLVDPDNRRTVDYGLRASVLDSLEHEFSTARPSAVATLLTSPEATGRAKMFIIWRILQLRARLPDLFRDGAYIPLLGIGDASDHVIAFARRHASTQIIIVVPRLTARLTRGRETPPVGEAVWRATRIPLSRLAAGGEYYTDLFTSRTLQSSLEAGAPVVWLKDLLAMTPIAILESSAPG